jgi:hypothetical protein
MTNNKQFTFYLDIDMMKKIKALAREQAKKKIELTGEPINLDRVENAYVATI